MYRNSFCLVVAYNSGSQFCLFPCNIIFSRTGNIQIKEKTLDKFSFSVAWWNFNFMGNNGRICIMVGFNWYISERNQRWWYLNAYLTGFQMNFFQIICKISKEDRSSLSSALQRLSSLHFWDSFNLWVWNNIGANCIFSYL